MNTFHPVVNNKHDKSLVQPWQEPEIVFERSLLAEAQGGPGPHGAPSGLLGPLALSGGNPSGCDPV